MESLIGYIAGRHRITQRENLATEILVYILDRAGSEVLRSLLKLSGVQIDPNSKLHLQPQRGDTESPGIPDIRVLDQTNHLCALIENKFDARFTSNQRSTYLLKLESGVRLLFVVPKRRKQKIKDKLREPFPKANDRKRLAVISWDEFLHTLKDILESKPLHSLEETALDRGRQQRRLLSDIEQLERYCDVIEKQIFDPFCSDQIQGVVLSEPIHQLTWITAELIEECRNQKLVRTLKKQELKGELEDDNSLSLGQNLELNGALIWMGLWVKMWREQREPCTTPLWIWLSDSDEADKLVGPESRSKARKIAKLIADAGIDVKRVEGEKGWVIPIPVKPDVQQEQVVEEAVEFVKRLHQVIRKRSTLDVRSSGRQSPVARVSRYDNN